VKQRKDAYLFEFENEATINRGDVLWLEGLLDQFYRRLAK